MTGPQSRSSVLVLDDPAAAELLVSAADRRFLEPFVGVESSTAQAARKLGETVEKTAYRVRRLAARGLLRPVRTLARKGRDITVYTAPSEIRAPLSLLASADIARLFDVMDGEGRSVFLASLARLAARHGVLEWTVRVHRDEADGPVLVDMVAPETQADPAVLGDGAPAVVFHWVPVALGDEAAKTLQRRLAALVADLPVSTTAPTHLVGLFLAPLG